MALPAPVQALYDRLKSFYNGSAYNPTSNPGGFARGGNQQGVFIDAMRDFADYGKAVAEVGAAVQADADRFQAAVDAIEAGPVSSVVGRSGIVTADHIKTAIGFDDLADDLTQKVDDALSQIPLFKPITMTVPAANATGLGSGGTYTFVVQAFAGDTIGFYPDYPVPLASRFVNVFEPGGNAPVAVLPVAGSGVAFPVNFTGAGLQTSHAYDFQAGYTDAQGNSVLSQRVRATTAAQFRLDPGQAGEGGFKAFNDFGDGGLFDLYVAPKSLEVSRQWTGGSQALIGAYSRLNGPKNTTDTLATSNASAQSYANGATFGSGTPYLAAIDEARAISFKLRPANAPAGSPFVSGGSEAFGGSSYWTSTEEAAANATSIHGINGAEENGQGKSNTKFVRPIKRIAVTPPIAVGTYVAAQGGWLWFYFTDLSSGSPLTYAVFKADKAVEVTRAWAANGFNSATGAVSRTSGVANGQTIIGDANGDAGSTLQANVPAVSYCRNLVHGGKDDWYFGAIDEMLAGARMNSQLPSAQQLSTSDVWTSTEYDASAAKVVNATTTAVESSGTKTAARIVVPIRRVILSALAA